MLQRLSIALAQVNADNTSDNFLNEFRQVICSLNVCFYHITYNSLLQTGTISEVQVNATGLEPNTT